MLFLNLKKLRYELFYNIKKNNCELIEESLNNYFIETKKYGIFQISLRQKKVLEILNNYLLRIEDKEIIFSGEYKPLFVFDEISFTCHYTDETTSTLSTGEIYLPSNEHDLFECYSCSDILHADDSSYSEHLQETLCTSCYDHSHNYCEDCDDTFHEDESCHCRAEDEERDHLAEYNERNKLYYLTSPKKESKKRKNQLFYGIEIEVELKKDGSMKDVLEKMKPTFDEEHILFKRDGSLNYGFEIVSTNATFDYHKNIFWKSFFSQKYTNEVKGYQAKTCGMHIHFSRSYFTDLEQKKLNTFYHSKSNRDFIQLIAGRSNNEYARFLDHIDMTDTITPSNQSDYKYRCINFCNDETIEIRIFQSNLKENSFFKNLEFVDSVNNFIKFTSINKLSFNDYINYLLSDTKKSYFNLYEFLNKNHLFSFTNYNEEIRNINRKGFINILRNIESEKKRKCV